MELCPGTLDPHEMSSGPTYKDIPSRLNTQHRQTRFEVFPFRSTSRRVSESRASRQFRMEGTPQSDMVMNEAGSGLFILHVKRGTCSDSLLFMTGTLPLPHTL